MSVAAQSPGTAQFTFAMQAAGNPPMFFLGVVTSLARSMLKLTAATLSAQPP